MENPYQSPRHVNTPEGNTPPASSPHDASAGGASASFQPIHLSGTLSLSDYYHASRMAYRRYWPRVSLGVAVVGVFVLLFSAIALSIRPYAPESANRILFTILVLIPILFVAPIIWQWIQLRRASTRRVGIFAETNSTITEDGISVAVPNATSMLAWPAFVGFRASERVAVVHTGIPKPFLIVARAKLVVEADWPRLLALLESKLKRL